MNGDLLSKYIWLVDTIKRYKRITRQAVSELWERSPISNGQKLTRRTFYNYKMAIEQIFNIVIECDQSTFEYYISEEDAHQESLNNWLLNSTATNNLITSSRDVSSRVFLEDVPSARDFLPIVVDALRANACLRFDYHPYWRSLPSRGVVIEPYFARIFKQRWYVVGRNVKDDRIKTYSLDRMLDVALLETTFKMPADFSPAEYFNDAFGIIVNQNEPKLIRLRVESVQAKYFRALPLHHSQQEMVHDQYSIFEYRMRVSEDLIAELLSYGPRVEVLAPKELRAAIAESLRASLANYE